uniref:Uncharacterized protein n=1 Tax=Triticum urartu TaxID=4572 RepID=A0A8R7USA5_TRIUA
MNWRGRWEDGEEDVANDGNAVAHPAAQSHHGSTLPSLPPSVTATMVCSPSHRCFYSETLVERRLASFIAWPCRSTTLCSPS